MPVEPPVAVASEHLRSLRAICQKFRRSRSTVKAWAKEKDCPIAFDGKSYMAEYNALMRWLCQQRRVKR